MAASLQDRDFEPLRAGEPLYETLDGELVMYDGSCGEVAYPVFINEAAYYYRESGRGVLMTTRTDWPVPPLPLHASSMAPLDAHAKHREEPDVDMDVEVELTSVEDSKE